MAQSKIEWTEAVWNPVTGCTKVSAGCKNCYAETIAKRFWKDRKFTDIETHIDRLAQPLKWRKPRMIFVNSMSDLFHEDVSFDFIDEVFRVMRLTPQHTYQILTKRPERMLEYMFDSDWIKPQSNVWLGVSVEDQKTADERIKELLRTPTVVRWISAEPLLGPIDLSKLWVNEAGGWKLNWVVVGGESGHKARECNLGWIESIVKQCKAADVPVFVKQLGTKSYIGPLGEPYKGCRIENFEGGKKSKFDDLPVAVAFREYPKV